MTHVARRCEVSILSIATLPTPEHLFVSLLPLDESTCRAGDAGIGWIHHGDSDSDEGSQQRYACTKVPRRMGFPSYQSGRVFNRHASPRALRHGHNAAGFTSEQLPLRTGFNAPINTALLVHGAAVALSFEYGPQVWPLVSIGAGNADSYTNVHADIFFHGDDFRQRDFYTDATVPLIILPEDFALLTERCAGIRQGSIDSPVLLGGDVQLAHPLHHHPQIKALRFARGLYVRRVDQFCFQSSWLMPSFTSPSPVRKRAAIGPTCKLSHALSRRVSGLLTKRCCAGSVIPRKESRQETKRIGLIGRREKFKLVAENNCLHTKSMPKTLAKCKVSWSRNSGIIL